MEKRVGFGEIDGNRAAAFKKATKADHGRGIALRGAKAITLKRRSAVHCLSRKTLAARGRKRQNESGACDNNSTALNAFHAKPLARAFREIIARTGSVRAAPYYREARK